MITNVNPDDEKEAMGNTADAASTETSTQTSQSDADALGTDDDDDDGHRGVANVPDKK